MLGEIFALFAAVLLVLRFASWGNEGRQFVVLDVFSAMFMMFAFYYFVFATNSTSIITSVATNASTLGNVVTLTNVTTTATHITVNSFGFIMLVVITASYMLFMFILALRDFIASRGIDI